MVFLIFIFRLLFKRAGRTNYAIVASNLSGNSPQFDFSSEDYSIYSPLSDWSILRFVVFDNPSPDFQKR